jgi:hypothetical protein
VVRDPLGIVDGLPADRMSKVEHTEGKLLLVA